MKRKQVQITKKISEPSWTDDHCNVCGSTLYDLGETVLEHLAKHDVKEQAHKLGKISEKLHRKQSI